MIYERNMQTLEDMGLEAWLDLDLGPRCPITGRTLNTPMKKKNPPNRPLPRSRMWPPSFGLRPGQSLELLKALHILTREGKLNQDSRRKLKQVYHLYQFIAPLGRTQRQRPPRHPGRPRRGQVLPGLHPVRPVLKKPGPGQHLRHRNPRPTGAGLAATGRPTWALTGCSF